jgi:hypothetical protein
MAEPAPKKAAAPSTDTISITYSNSQYGINPVDSSVANDGSVYFVCAQACWIYTQVDGEYVNAFEGETNDYIPCNGGSNGPFTPAYEDTVIDIYPVDPNAGPPVRKPIDIVKGSISVGSMGEHKKHRE